jgi:membrane associated rhomboid family serine protease
MTSTANNLKEEAMAGYKTAYSIVPPVIKALLIANGGMFLLQLSFDNTLIQHLALWPLDLTGRLVAYDLSTLFRPWQLASYAFLHGGLLHLLLNMYALWLFGSRMENVWGSHAFALYYFVCVIGAGVIQLIVASYSGEIYPTIGASGGVFGVLLAFGMIFPNERLMLVFPPVILKAKWFVIIFGAIELWAGVTGSEAGVAHFAHLGGMLFGYLLLLHWRTHPPLRR